jgi:trans-aconitate methyltransferase
MLSSKDYWENVKRVNAAPPQHVLFEDLFFRYIKTATPGQTAIEVGCVPGTFLAFISKHFGFFPEGVDFAQSSRDVTTQTLRSFGLTECKVYIADFLDWSAPKKYDLVLSFGFIEHFKNSEEVIDRHIRLLKRGSKLILEMPNFANGQKVLHSLLDQENLSRHNTEIMNLAFFKTIVKKYNLHVDYLGYYGGPFDFWWENNNPTLPQRLVYSLLKPITKVSRFIGKKWFLNNKFFSPFLIMFAEYPSS